VFPGALRLLEVPLIFYPALGPGQGFEFFQGDDMNLLLAVQMAQNFPGRWKQIIR